MDPYAADRNDRDVLVSADRFCPVNTKELYAS